MTDLLTQARALGDPTRHELFRYIAEADRPVEIAELTKHLGLHHNAIRQHLAKLVNAHLVSEASVPSDGRGRPRLCYILNASAESRWGVIGPYERLALLFSEIIKSGDTPVEVGRRAGRKMHAKPNDALAPDTDPVEDLVQAMSKHGFEPEAKRRGKQIDIVFGVCPFETTAMADPDTVCGLHLGLAFGASESIDGLVVDELTEHDPRHGNCRLRCHIES